nr:beta-L-arabinofuranosidase domain-containing protein [Phytohabitans rumicis]
MTPRTGPVAPTDGALRPLDVDGVRLNAGGLLGAWQRRNATATLPHCVAQLEEAGALDNVRRVLGLTDREHTPMWFADSDIYKTLEAAAWELAHPDADPRLREFVESTAELLAKVQDDDGYLNTYFTTEKPELRWRELDWSHELYCAGHLIQAAVAAARVGVGERLPGVARRFADLIVARYGPGGVPAVCGHAQIETALVELYRLTGHRPYLDTARRFIDLRGQGLGGHGRFGPAYWQDHVPVREASTATGHVVRQWYLLAGAVDVAVETGDPELISAAERLWEDAHGTKTYITGGQGARHRDEAFGNAYELPPERAYAETCGAIASFQWNWRMLLATGTGRYADAMETALYNAIAAAIATDGRHFFYANPLQRRADHDSANDHAPDRRQPWYSCACCPPNLARLMASLQSYLATTDADGLQVHLYGSGMVSARVGDTAVGLAVVTGYPWQGQVRMTVTTQPAQAPREWTLALRIPAWCTSFTLTVDGAPVTAPVRAGYARISRAWPTTSTVVLDLDMPRAWSPPTRTSTPCAAASPSPEGRSSTASSRPICPRGFRWRTCGWTPQPRCGRRPSATCPTAWSP